MYKVGLIGCGNIAETYFRSQIYFNNIKIISCADINVEAAKKCANQYNIHSMLVDDMLANDDIIKVNFIKSQPKPEYSRSEIKRDFNFVFFKYLMFFKNKFGLCTLKKNGTFCSFQFKLLNNCGRGSE